jgi:hypothetical protein
MYCTWRFKCSGMKPCWLVNTHQGTHVISQKMSIFINNTGRIWNFPLCCTCVLIFRLLSVLPLGFFVYSVCPGELRASTLTLQCQSQCNVQISNSSHTTSLTAHSFKGAINLRSLHPGQQLEFKPHCHWTIRNLPYSHIWSNLNPIITGPLETFPTHTSCLI